MKRALIISLGSAVAIGRLFIVPRLVHIPSYELSYETFAHLICGALIGIHLYNRQEKLCGALGWGIAFWELGCFVLQKSLHWTGRML